MAPLNTDNLAKIWAEKYNATKYQPNGVVGEFKATARFGFPSDFVLLLEGTTTDKDEYIKGIVCGAIIIGCIFIIWCIVLLILRLLGPQRVGFFSGVIRKPARPPLSSQNVSSSDLNLQEQPVEESMVSNEELFDEHNDKVKNDDLQYEKEVRGFKKRLKWFRIFFLFAALCVIIASILFYSQGISSLIGSIESVQDVSRILRDIILRADTAAKAFVEDTREDFTVVTQRIDDPNDSVSDWCPNNTQLNETIVEMRDLLQNASAEASVSAKALIDDFTHLLEYQQDLDDTLESIKPVFYTTLSITIVLNILVLILVVCVIVAWRKVEKKTATKCRGRLLCLLKCVRNCVTLPIFVIFMLLSWIISAAFLAASVGSSDFCIDPDKIVLTMLGKQEQDLSVVLYDALAYYIKGCENAYYTDALDNYDIAMTALTLGTVTTHEGANELLSVDWDSIASTCSNSFNPTALRELLLEFDLILHNVFALIEAIQDIMQCSSLNPIYTKSVYQAICVDAVGGFAWVFTTALIIAIGSMTMITLRVAYYEIKEHGEDELDEKEEFEDAVEENEFDENIVEENEKNVVD